VKIRESVAKSIRGKIKNEDIQQNIPANPPLSRWPGIAKLVLELSSHPIIKNSNDFND